MILLIALLAAWPGFGHQTVREDRGVAKSWRYDIVRDHFSGAQTCTMTRGAIEISGGFATFKLGGQVDTTEALYRIDDGPVKAWRTLAPSLVAAGVKVQDDSLANPSRGWVILPLPDVEAAHQVEIRPAGQKNPHRFRLIALAPAIALAAQRGCRLESAQH